MRIGTKSLLGLSFKQVGLCFFDPLSFGSTPPHSRLCRLNVNSVTQHFPLCSNWFRWDSWVLLWSLMYIYICLRISYGVKRMKYKTFTTASLHWGLETTLGGELARWAGGRRQQKMQNIESARWLLNWICSFWLLAKFHLWWSSEFQFIFLIEYIQAQNLHNYCWWSTPKIHQNHSSGCIWLQIGFEII